MSEERLSGFERVRKTPIRTGVVGLGNILPHYMDYFMRDPLFDIAAFADRVPEVAENRAREFGIASAGSYNDLLSNPDIELILDLTNPASHAEVREAALRAGKHVYGEKPLATTYADGKKLLDTANEVGSRLGCAPDTFLNANIQTARKVTDEGLIGYPVAVRTNFAALPESWHPNPEFLYREGAGPVMDMAPYYLTALVAILGPIREVAASGEIIEPNRMIHKGTKAGELFSVDPNVPTYVSSEAISASGVTAVMNFSFEGESDLPHIEIYGTSGTLRLADPNSYDDNPLLLTRNDGFTWEEVALLERDFRCERGIGAELFVHDIYHNQKSRVDASLALHVLEAMDIMQQSVHGATKQQLTTTVARPEPLYANLF